MRTNFFEMFIFWMCMLASLATFIGLWHEIAKMFQFNPGMQLVLSLTSMAAILLVAANIFYAISKRKK